jgi:hypothetical protein
MPYGGLWRSTKSHQITLPSLRNKDMHDNVVTSVRTSDRDTNDFPINIGLHRGSALSPYLFALVMYEVTRDIQGGIT